MNAAPSQLIGKQVYDIDHQKVGKVTDLYVEEGSDKPTWATVATGWFGTKESFVPLAITHFEGDEVEVDATQDIIKNAPTIEHDSEISAKEEAILYQYYNDVFEPEDQGSNHTESRDEARTDDTMIRSEEEAHVQKETRERGRAHIKKYVTTEDVNMTIPVTREELHVDREPISENDRRGYTGRTDLTDDDQEIVLREEVPVIAKETVPKEKIRLNKEQVTKDRTLNDQVRKEHVDTDDISE